jgi:hypothetical protein
MRTERKMKKKKEKKSSSGNGEDTQINKWRGSTDGWGPLEGRVALANQNAFSTDCD